MRWLKWASWAFDLSVFQIIALALSAWLVLTA